MSKEVTHSDGRPSVVDGSSYPFVSDANSSPSDAERAAGVGGRRGNEPLSGIDDRYAYRFIKRAFDIVFSAAAMTLFSWLYAGVTIAIKVDDPKGPVIFRQTRIGKNGVPFTMYKFCSMVADAETHLGDLEKFNEKDGPVFKIAADPRVTRVGRIIRKLSIDELPQFLNVLKGDMSVVGPKPALPKEVAQYSRYQEQRLLVRSWIAWDIIAPKPEAGKKVSGARILSAYEGSRTIRAVAA